MGRVAENPKSSSTKHSLACSALVPLLLRRPLEFDEDGRDAHGHEAVHHDHEEETQDGPKGGSVP